MFKVAVAKAGIAYVTSHCLRHSSITEAVHVDGANVVAIASAAGHSLKTAEGYIHTSDDRLQQAVAGLGNIVP